MEKTQEADIKVDSPPQQGGIEIKIPMEELQKRKLFFATPMYGGQCGGMFTRSVADLAASCAKYGIQLQMYFLFNESLITRARNYCCLPYNAEIETEDGIKTMKEIVDHKYKGKVLSIDKTTGKFSYQKVINHWRKPNNEKKWVSVKFNKEGKRSNIGKQLVCTDDHRCLVVKDPLHPKLEYVEAKDLKGTYLTRIVNKKKNTANNGALYNKEQLSVLTGILLGDGYISPTGRLTINHCEQQQDYIKLNQQILGGKIRNTVAKKMTGTGYLKEEYFGYSLGCPINAQTKKLRELAYPNGKKSVKNILQYIDEKSLAFWYMDDGYLTTSRGAYPTMGLCTHGFTYADNILLKEMFSTTFDINCAIKKDKTYYYLVFPYGESLKFWNIVAPYICDSMKYKLPKEFHNVNSKKIDVDNLEYAVKYVETVSEKTHVVNTDQYSKKFTSDLYDIEVENNHNFVANQSLVSNCDEFMRSDCTHMLFIDSDIGFNPQDVIAMLAMQSDDSPYDILGAPYPKKCIAWEKIKKAVDKGFADENPNNLDRFVGDFVFNPKSGSGSIPIHIPAEVMEIGTGFMMIRRRTLEVFKEKYPYMLYKPDHVRTEHFDGSREIMSYFDCIIDRGYSIGDLQNVVKEGMEGTVSHEDTFIKIKEMFEGEKKSSKRYLSEDYKFCYDAAKAGLKIWLCPWMKTSHVGTFIFGGSLLDLAQLGAAATADVEELNRIKHIEKKKRESK